MTSKRSQRRRPSRWRSPLSAVLAAMVLATLAPLAATASADPPPPPEPALRSGVSVEPVTVAAGTTNDHTITMVAAQEPGTDERPVARLPELSPLRLEIPSSFTKPQLVDPDAPGYLAVRPGGACTANLTGVRGGGSNPWTVDGSLSNCWGDTDATIVVDYLAVTAPRGTGSPRFIAKVVYSDYYGQDVLGRDHLVTLEGSAGDGRVYITPAPAQTLKVSLAPSTGTAGSTWTPTVSAVDQFGNIDPSVSGSVTFASNDTNPATVLPGNVALVGGTVTVPNGITLVTAGIRTVTAAVGSLSGVVKAAVAPAAASQFQVTAPTAAKVGVPVSLRATAKDPFGNVVTGYLGSVSVRSPGFSKDQPPYRFVAADKGTHVFSGVSFSTVGSQEVSVADRDASGVTGSVTVRVVAGDVHHFGVEMDPLTVAGRLNDIRVTAFDELGNVVTGYRGRIDVASSPSTAKLPPSYSFTAADNGTRVFTRAASFDDEGPYTVTVTDRAVPTVTGSASVEVANPGELAGFRVEAPTSTPAGAGFAVKVSAVDAYGDLVRRYDGRVALSLGLADPRATLPTELVIARLDGGEATVPSARLFRAGAQTIEVSTIGEQPAFTGSAAVTVTPLTAARVRFQTDPALPVVSGRSVIVAGRTVNLTATVVDGYDNRVPSYRGVAAVTPTDEPAVPSSLIFDATAAGQVTVPVAFSVARPLALTVSAPIFPIPPPTDTRPPLKGVLNLTVRPDYRVELSGITTAQKGVASSFTVTVRNGATGDVATDYRGRIVISSSDGGATVPAAYTFTAADAGRKTFTPGATFAATGSQTLTATDFVRPEVTASTAVDVQTNGPAVRFDLQVLPAGPVKAGDVKAVIVTARDAAGRQVVDFDGEIAFSSSDPSATVPANYRFQPANRGKQVFNSIRFTRAGAQSVTATSTADAQVTGSAPVTVTAGTATSFKLDVGEPATLNSSNQYVVTAGAPFQLTVTAVDRYGNRAQDFRGSAVVTAAPEILFGNVINFGSTDGGQRTVPVVLRTASSKALQVRSSAGSNNLPNLADVTGRVTMRVTPGRPVMIDSMATTHVRQGAGSRVSFTMRDGFGNVASPPFSATTEAGQGVTFTSSDPLATLPVGIRPISSLYPVKFGTRGAQTVTVTATYVTDPSTGATVTLPPRTFSFTVNDPYTASLELTAPDRTLPGQPADITVTARNADGSVDTSYIGEVSFTTDDPDPSAVVPAPFRFTAADLGTRTFPGGLTLRTRGSTTVAVTGPGGGSRPALTDQATIAVGVPNDDFADAEVLSGATGSVEGTNVGATSEPDEPGVEFSEFPLSEPTVWYRWVAPQSGGVNLDTCTETDFDSTVTVYTGSALSALDQEAYGDDGCGVRTRLSFTATAGQEYWFQVSGYDGETGSFRLRWETIAGPDNDDLANARVITKVSGSVDGTTVGATAEAGEPHYELEGSANHSVWYSWVSPRTGVVNLDTCLDPTFDSTLGVYTGDSVDQLDVVVQEDIDYWGSCGGPEGPAVTAFDATAGQRYWIQVDGRYGEVGTFTLRWSTSGVSPNDDFADAQEITGPTGSTLGKTFLAGIESGEPVRQDGSQGTVWYRWTAPATGPVSFSTCEDSNESMILTVFTGSSLTGLTEVARTTEPCGEGGSASFEAEVGETYMIQADGFETSRGFFWLSWNQE